jgi:hypothetical protein
MNYHNRKYGRSANTVTFKLHPEAYIQTDGIKNVPRSDHYRAELEPLIGRKILIEGIFIRQERWVKYGRGGSRMLICHAKVIRHPKEFIGTDFGVVDHVWFMVDRRTPHRIGAVQGERVRASGKLYEYVRRLDNGEKVRNVGLRVYEVAAVKNGTELL